MGELYAGGLMLGVFAAIGAIFIGGYNVGKYDGELDGESKMRPKVVTYCIEKPQPCKEEYDSIKTQLKLNAYQLSEIK